VNSKGNVLPGLAEVLVFLSHELPWANLRPG
jgi:hypothetical protein